MKYVVNDVVLVSLLLTLYIFHTFFSVSIVDFVHIFICWDIAFFEAAKGFQWIKPLFLV